MKTESSSLRCSGNYGEMCRKLKKSTDTLHKTCVKNTDFKLKLNVLNSSKLSTRITILL